MQNRYAGDVGDFVKYGLLRALCKATSEPLRLGVLWYLVPDEAGNGDGSLLHHLAPKQRDRFRRCDEELFDVVAEVAAGERSVRAIERSGILGADTAFHSTPLTFDASTGRATRQRHREGWAENGWARTAGCDLVFFDPDNGLEVKSVGAHDKRGPKFTLYREVAPYLSRNQSVVIYQHAHRSGAFDAQLRQRLLECHRLRPEWPAPWALRAKTRAFIVMPSPRHQAALGRKSEWMLDGGWKEHFSQVAA